MKKALSILLTAALLLTCLAGCGGAGSASPSGTGRVRHQPKHGGRKRPRIEAPGQRNIKASGV